jgi:hypothetical protein
LDCFQRILVALHEGLATELQRERNAENQDAEHELGGRVVAECLLDDYKHLGRGGWERRVGEEGGRGGWERRVVVKKR